MKKFFQQLLDVYTREFRLVMKDGGLILFFTFLPLVYPVIYSLIYNPEVVRDVPMVVVDNDRSQASRDMVRKLDATQETRVIGYASDMSEARHAMASKDCFAILEIPENFGRNIGRGEQAQAVMFCDMTLLLRYRGFLVATTSVASEMGSEITMERIATSLPLASTIATGDPMPIENIALGNIESGFDSFIMPGVIVLILHQCIILAVGMAGGARRERRYLGYEAGKKAPSVAVSMLGRSLCYISILLFPTIFLIHYIPLIFAFPVAGHGLDAFLFLLPMVLACLGVGFMFQGIVYERESVFVLWVVTSVVFLFLSGLTWPRYAMNGFWRILSDLIPATWGVEGFIRINTNGASLSQVAPDYINLWILAGVYMLGGWAVQKWMVRPQLRQRLALK